MVGIYFPLYDALTAELEASSSWVAPYAPLLAGSAARTVAVLCTSPLELIRTRMQAGPSFCCPDQAEPCCTGHRLGLRLHGVQQDDCTYDGKGGPVLWLVCLSYLQSSRTCRPGRSLLHESAWTFNELTDTLTVAVFSQSLQSTV